MADRPQMPTPPKDCVYGPWWDGVISRWLAITPPREEARRQAVEAARALGKEGE